MVRYFWSTNPILLRDLAWRREDALSAVRAPVCGNRSPDPGWYVICDNQRTPLYVGKAGNLNYRLNSKNGTRDDFANPRRSSDSSWNFLKALRSMGYISALCVAVVREPDLLRRVGAESPLVNVDKGNVEKMLRLFAYTVVAAAIRAPRAGG